MIIIIIIIIIIITGGAKVRSRVSLYVVDGRSPAVNQEASHGCPYDADTARQS